MKLSVALVFSLAMAQAAQQPESNIRERRVRRNDTDESQRIKKLDRSSDEKEQVSSKKERKDNKTVIEVESTDKSKDKKDTIVESKKDAKLTSKDKVETESKRQEKKNDKDKLDEIDSQRDRKRIKSKRQEKKKDKQRIDAIDSQRERKEEKEEKRSVDKNDLRMKLDAIQGMQTALDTVNIDLRDITLGRGDAEDEISAAESIIATTRQVDESHASSSFPVRGSEKMKRVRHVGYGRKKQRGGGRLQGDAFGKAGKVDESVSFRRKYNGGRNKTKFRGSGKVRNFGGDIEDSEENTTAFYKRVDARGDDYYYDGKAAKL